MMENKAWGSVEHVFYNSEIGLSLLTVFARTRSSWHFHRYRHNYFLVQSGAIAVEYYPLDRNDMELHRQILKPGDCFCVRAFIHHRFRVLESGHLVEIYTSAGGPGVALDDIDRSDCGGPDTEEIAW